MYFSRNKGLTYNNLHIQDTNKKDMKSGQGVSQESEKKDDEQRVPLENLQNYLKTIKVKKK